MENAYAGLTGVGGATLDDDGVKWVESIPEDKYYKQTFGWIATSIESFLEENDLPVEPN